MISQLYTYFLAFVALGAPAMMFVIITLLSLLFKVKLLKALEGALLMAIALTGMGMVISLLTNAFTPALNQFVVSTGLSLSVTDLGWSPLAMITWGSISTLYFVLICTVTNVILLSWRKVNTLNVDLFNLWNLSIIGLLTLYYSNNNWLLTTLVIVGIYSLVLINGDVLQPQIKQLLNYKGATTTAHPSLLICPAVLLVNLFISKMLPFIDRYDFDAKRLNEKIGFWGSTFVIGALLGVFVGLLGHLPPKELFVLAFTAGVSLELFSVIGGWFGPAMQPLSEGITKVMEKRFQGRQIFVAIDWPILAARAELWAVVNLLIPVVLVIAIILPGNTVLPLGGIMLTTLVPALLIITQGKVIRMTLIGAILTPLFLWAATLISEFVTTMSAITSGNNQDPNTLQQMTSIDADPIEKMLSILIAKSSVSLDITLISYSVAALLIYLSLFIWYVRKMKANNKLILNVEQPLSTEVA